MKNSINNTIMSKLVSGLGNKDKYHLINFLRMQANYTYFNSNKGLKNVHARADAQFAKIHMNKNSIKLSNLGKKRLNLVDINSMSKSQKMNWGKLASKYAKSHPELLSSKSNSLNINPKIHSKVKKAWHNIDKIYQKQVQLHQYYVRNGFPFNVIMKATLPKDRIPLAHLIRDKSRINYAKTKGYHAYKYQNDFKRNSEYITPQGFNDFNALVKDESPKKFNSLGFASDNFIKKYNRVHPRNFNLKQNLSKISPDNRLSTAQYLNDMSKGFYFGLHDKVRLGNNLIDKGKNASEKLSANDYSYAHQILIHGMKHHMLNDIGYQAHIYVNNGFKHIKNEKYQNNHSHKYTNKISTASEDNSSLNHVDLASKLFNNKSRNPTKTSHHFDKKTKPTLHPKKYHKESHISNSNHKISELFSKSKQRGQSI